ncbi:MAG TPA: alpha/beta fold hydrolase [Gaiellaceae bacterium]|nr:alpha/beta fold hydrolase [Gaiellaceae bacterium]
MGRLVLATAALAALAVVSGAASAGNPQPAPGVPPGLTKCTHAPGAWCGTVFVPLDRTGVVVGTTPIRFEYYPRSNTGQSQLGTIVAAEGGPGYSTTDSRDYYLDLFGPLQDRRALLLVDQRGTGLSDPFMCAAAQVYDGNWIANAEACGAQLGRRSDLYTSAAAAHDLKAVLDSIGVTQLDLYGDSYGSFFSQAFAVRYPSMLRTLVLDATYPISGLDALYRTSATRLRENLALFCTRSAATCPTTPGDMVALVDRVLQRIRADAITTTAPDGTGRETTVRFTPRKVLDVLLYTDGTPGWIREAPAALTAFLAGNLRPLGRMVAEGAIDPAAAARLPGGLRPRAEIRSFSEGAYLAYGCTDYPAIWNKASTFAARESQYAAVLASQAPAVFAPWRAAEYADSDFFVYEYCLHWPAPRAPEPPFPAGGSYPRLQALVLNGEFDIRTDVYQARAVAQNFRATYLEAANMGHVTALYDADACAAAIVRRFVQSLATGDTTCLTRISEHRLVQRFAARAADAPEATVASGTDRSTAADRRAAWIAVETLADVVDRWYAVPGTTGSGLYGGKFTMTSTAGLPFTSRVWSLKLNGTKWTTDVEVTGTATMPRGAGQATASLTIGGPGTAKGDLTVTWSTRAQGAQARIAGSIGGRAVDLTRPAPSHW